MIVGICWFLDPEPFGPLHLPPHVIHTILRFFPQPDSLHSQIFRKAGQKKAEPNSPTLINAIRSSHYILSVPLILSTKFVFVLAGCQPPSVAPRALRWPLLDLPTFYFPPPLS
jgi:hypothetical protein